MPLLRWKPILLGCFCGFGFALYSLVRGFDRYDLSVRQFVLVNLVEPIATELGRATGDTEGWTGGFILKPLLWLLFWTLVGLAVGLTFNLMRMAASAWRDRDGAA
jgi:hypothetical protein